MGRAEGILTGLVLLVLGLMLWFLSTCGYRVEPVDPVRACQDVGDAVLSSHIRCNRIPPSGVAQVWRSITRDCETRTSLRDADSLYGTCIPWLRQLHCDDLDYVAALAPAECVNQLR